MTEIAKAYVQIVPTTQNIGSQLSAAMNDECAAAGDSAGHSLGSSLISKVKGIVAAAGIGAIVKKAISEGADYEQNIGGIETLFKDSSDKMLAYAKQAYATAGVSANDYMSQATSFAASLLTSLDGDTSAAAEAANQAIIDMSDNANKMGTDISAIQNAYQGFAKQNYTMLDNLKLGYGGTKTEMERLLADAEKISGVHYDISNLSDVYSAIHVIQDELDITGTTAKEAATTFSGSMASMKAAASNLFAEWATGGDVKTAMANLIEAVKTFVLGNLVPMIGNILSGIPDMLIALGEAIISFDWAGTVQSLLGNLQSGISEAAGKLFGAEGSAGNIIMTLADGIIEKIPEAANTAVNIISSLADGLLSKLPDILTTAGEIVLHLIKGLLEKVPDVIASAGQLMINLIEGLITHLPEILQAGITIIGNLVAGILQCLPNIITAAGELATNLKNKFTEIDWGSIGRNIINGIAEGIRNIGGVLIDAARNAASAAFESAKRFLGIASPSKKFAEIGKFSMMGLAGGIEKNTDMVKEAIDDVSKEALRSGEIGMDIYSSAIEPVRAYTQPVNDTTAGKYITDVKVRFEGSLSQLASVLQPYIVAETKRLGESFG